MCVMCGMSRLVLVRFLGLMWRGFRDVFEQMIFMAGLTIGWWLMAAPVVIGVLMFLTAPLLLPLLAVLALFVPPATVTLFSMADPRRIVSRPEFSDVRDVFLSTFKRGWMIGLATVPVLLILGWNIGYFSGSGSFLAAFVPLWVIMFIFLFILMLYMYSLAGTMESGLRNAFRGGMFVLISRPFTALFLSVLILVFGVIFTVMVIPMFLLGPSLMAAVVNRFVLDTLQVEVIDPNSPTVERAYEREKGMNPDPGIWERIKRGGRS